MNENELSPEVEHENQNLQAGSSHLDSSKIAFLGCGKMGEAILAGLLHSGCPQENISATTRQAQAAEHLAETYNIRTGSIEENGPKINAEQASGADIVVITMKPNMMTQICQDIADSLKPNSVVVSVAAGVTIEMLEQNLPEGQAVVRSMPNTPLMVGRGVVGLSRGTHCSQDQLDKVQNIFASLGTVVEVPEEQQDDIAAISGSGPAYVFYFTSALENAAKELGFEDNIAEIIAQDTVAGAGAMLDTPGSTPKGLQDSVTSPNGTTAAALNSFEKNGLYEIVLDAARAAERRSKEITAELSSDAE